MPTVTVSNASQLMSALSSATSNTTILMKAGNYDNLYISGNKIAAMSNSSSVTLKSADANNPASITSMILIGAKNITFDGIEFDYNSASGANVSHRPFMVLSSDNVTFKNSDFDGDKARGVASNADGYGTGIALGIKDTNNLTITNNTFDNFHKGVVIDNGRNIVVTNNDVSAMASDGLNFSAVTNVTITGNHLHDFASHPNTSAHKDMIQFWAQNGAAGSQNVLIKDNILNSGTGTYTQSFLIKTENGSTHRDFRIENNLIHNSFTHGITLDNMRGVLVQNNTVLYNADTAVDSSGLYIPRIHIGSNVSNATVSKNVTHAISGNNWSGSGNLIIQHTDPSGQNYYGDLFVNGLVGGTATLKDLTPITGSVIDTSGIGVDLSNLTNISSLTTTTTTPTTTTTTPTTTTTTTGGTTTTDTGTTTKTTSTTSTKSITAPEVIDADYENGYRDNAGKANAVTNKGAQIVTWGGSKVVKLDSKDVVTYKDSPELFGNSSYTVMANFRKDQLGDSGKLITFAGSFVIQVKKDGLSVSVTTDKGTKWMHTKAAVNDTKMHSVALTFDNGTGTAKLYLDGKQISSIGGLKGAIQKGNASHDFHVGSPWGDSFDGMVDNVSFITSDLTAGQIQAVHNGNLTVGTGTTTTTTTTTPTTTTTTTGGTTSTDTGTTTKTTSTTSTKSITAPEVIDADYENGYRDNAGKANAVTNKGAQIVTWGGSKVVKLDSKDVVTYKDSPELFGNSSYTVMADFRKDQLGDSGKLITFAGSFVIQVKKDGLSVSVTTDKGTKWMHTKAAVNDTKMHSVALTFDNGTGTAKLYLDGKQISSIGGLKGAIQKGNASHDFHVGSPWGDSFDGMVDNVSFITSDLTAGQIQAVHNGNLTVGTGTTTTTTPTTTTTTTTGGTTSTDTGTTTSSGHFSYTMTAKNTKVVLDKAAKQGIIDQAYLSGDTASTFNVKVIDTASTARFKNTLGVYEYNDKGKIMDVRIIDADAQSGGNFKITSVDKGYKLGFFIVQDGYDRLDNAILNGNTSLSLVVKSGDVYLKAGSAVLKDKVFISHNKNLNVDNFEHVTSMDNPNSTGAIITFEDQYKGGRQNDQTDVVFEVTAVGADELSFA